MAKTAKSTTTRASRARAAPRADVADGMQSLMSGLGTEKDKSSGISYAFGELDQGQLELAYRGDWIARKAVDIPADDSTREWREWQAGPEQVTAIEELEKRFMLQQKVCSALKRARLYGGSALVLGVDQGDPEDELIVQTLDKDCLKFVHVVSRNEITAGEVELNILSPYYGEPKYYEQMSSAGSVRLHPSRVVRFVGNEVLDIARTNSGWGDSVLQSVNDAVVGAGVVSGSIAQLVGESKIDVIKIPGLTENIRNADYEARLKKRFSFANMAKGVFSLLLLDKEEEWQRINSQFAGLPDVLKLYLLIASAAVDVPATRFLSQSPAGLNSTGDSDIRNYYDRLSTEQNTEIRPRLTRLDEVLIRSALGRMDTTADIFYEWFPLWQLSETEKADIAVKYSTVFKTDLDSGLINEVVLKKAREAQLIADGTYPGLQQLIDEWDDDPNLENQPTPPPPQLPPDAAPALPGTTQTGALPAPPPPPAKLPPPSPSNRAVDGMLRRLHDASTPRSLYVRRDLINKAEVAAWAKANGIENPVSDMHVTLVYSRQPVDWLMAGSSDGWREDDNGNLTINPGGPRVIEYFDGGAVVLAFASSALSYRHHEILERTGGTHDYEDYTPHVTLTKDPGFANTRTIQPYAGKLVFGPEIFEETKQSDPVVAAGE